MINTSKILRYGVAVAATLTMTFPVFAQNFSNSLGPTTSTPSYYDAQASADRAPARVKSKAIARVKMHHAAVDRDAASAFASAPGATDNWDSPVLSGGGSAGYNVMVRATE